MRKEKLLKYISKNLGTQAQDLNIHFSEYSFQNNPFVFSFQG